MPGDRRFPSNLQSWSCVVLRPFWDTDTVTFGRSTINDDEATKNSEMFSKDLGSAELGGLRWVGGRLGFGFFRGRMLAASQLGQFRRLDYHTGFLSTAGQKWPERHLLGAGPT